MTKITKTMITPKWEIIKNLYDANTNGSDKYGTNFEIGGELDKMCNEFTEMLGEITRRMGHYSVIEGIKMELWKERIWNLIENAGLLPEIAWKDDKEFYRIEEIKLSQSKFKEEYEFDFESREHEAYNIDSSNKY